jgi:hypothetical protein
MCSLPSISLLPPSYFLLFVGLCVSAKFSVVLAAVPLAFCPTVQRKPVRVAKAVHELVYELAGLGALGALGRTACRAAAHAEFCKRTHSIVREHIL